MSCRTPSQADLSKDTEKSRSGAKPIPRLQNNSQHEVAVFLARQASLQFMTDAFERWPLLKDLNGERLAFEIMLDRRGVDQARRP